MLFPIGDDNTGRKTVPFVVYGLIAANVLVFLVQMTAGQKFTEDYATVPAEIVRGDDLVTLLTSMFMHGSIMHIVGNMLYLWIFGDQIEDYLGHVKFLIFYLICGFAADFAHILFNASSTVPTLGASGAISGVLGAYLVKFPKNQVKVLMGRMLTTVPALVALGLWIVLQIASQYMDDTGAGGVAYMAHIGGFLAGVVLIFVLGFGKRPVATTA